ncbi:hypothetical protein PPYR_01228 [Photinus pyralis]|uniref:Uncharacterized protein n=1 Tax=Photinus pyralis TaxID=7054 RepID=A0A5N4B404_PHOPY|nr:hypothetical protein PPYR_01228 [Photinus pyralis]
MSSNRFLRVQGSAAIEYEPDQKSCFRMRGEYLKFPILKSILRILSARVSSLGRLECFGLRVLSLSVLDQFVFPLHLTERVLFFKLNNRLDFGNLICNSKGRRILSRISGFPLYQ